ncbi:MAG: hypothetical protein K8H90_09145, partial [Thermoanaerobaculia bacterium]|nr:hypothetical protein [Thermoanaerobaculia bacterium]
LGNTVNPVDLLYLRITMAARTSRPDSTYQADDLDGDPSNGQDLLEDNDYESAPASVFKQGINRGFRHRILQTVVDLRNLG